MASSKELVEYIAKALVAKPEEVEVVAIEGDRTSVLQLKVAPEEKGRVIGKEGRIAEAMRTLLKVAAAREGKRVILEIR